MKKITQFQFIGATIPKVIEEKAVRNDNNKNAIDKLDKDLEAKCNIINKGEIWVIAIA